MFVFGQMTVGTPGAVTKKYFDGTQPAGSTNLLDPANNDELMAFANSLTKFNGAALGCTDGTVKPYSGAPMDKAHKGMGITGYAFDFHNAQVLQILAAKGANAADQSDVLGALESLRSAIVQPTICDKYSEALKLTNKQLVTAVVGGTFGKITAATSPILKYFNGVKPPGSTNYVGKDKDQLPALVDGLVTFFGGALGCTDGTIGKYTGPSMKGVHGRMGININEFSFFNKNVLTVLVTSGVSMSDARAVETVLNSTRTEIVSA